MKNLLIISILSIFIIGCNEDCNENCTKIQFKNYDKIYVQNNIDYYKNYSTYKIEVDLNLKDTTTNNDIPYCCNYESRMLSEIDSIVVNTIYDFNDNYKAGSKVNNIFMPVLDGVSYGGAYDDLINKLNEAKGSDNSSYYDEYSEILYLQTTSIEPKDLNDKQKFVVKIYFDNNKSLSDTTDEVNFN